MSIVAATLTLILVSRIASHYRQEEQGINQSMTTERPDTPYQNSSDRNRPFITNLIALAPLLIQPATREIHWAFLRASLWESLLTMTSPPAIPVYWAVWLSVPLAAMDILIGRDEGQSRFTGLLILLLTSVIFLYLQNIYLACCFHMVVAIFWSNPDLTEHTQRQSWRQKLE